MTTPNPMNPYQGQAPTQPPPGHPQPVQPQHITVNVPERKRVNHVLHLILTILTGGVWAPVWILLALLRS